MTNVYIKVHSFMVRGLISEAETVDTSLLDYKFELIASLVTRIMELIAIRVLNLQ
jgi:hypothetical protein